MVHQGRLVRPDCRVSGSLSAPVSGTLGFSKDFFEKFFANKILPASGLRQRTDQTREIRAIPRIVHFSPAFCSLSQS
jgi:hypothetical protein